MIYGAGFAAAYGPGWRGFATRVAPGIVRLLRAAGVRGGRVVDLGCGTGVLAAALGTAGYDVWGVDQSVSMLTQARRAAPRAEFQRGDLRSVALPSADAALSTFDTLNYLRSPAALRGLFRRVRRALRSGGVFIFDLVTLRDLGRKPSERHTVREGDGFVACLRVSRDPARRLKRYEIATFTRRGKSYRREDEVHVQRVYASREVLRLLRAAGFRAVMRRSYGGTRPDPGRRVFVARVRG